MELDAAFRQAGAVSWGSVSFSTLAAQMPETRRHAAGVLCPGAQTVLVALFSYYVKSEGNLSAYARGPDYHRMLLRRLSAVRDTLKARYPHGCFAVLVDDSPLPERMAAQLSGAGFLGDNGLIYAPGYGSYVFIGTILTDVRFPETRPDYLAECLHCGACGRACPAGVLPMKPGFAGRCLSHITQKKGALSEGEENQIRRAPLIWGCDRCQEVCPVNGRAQETALPEFWENRIERLDLETLSALSGRAFRKIYHGYAFSWRGKGPLMRNLLLQKEREDL